jgi:hypothetical protein
MSWTFNTPDGVANGGPQITAVAVVFTALSFMFLLLRFYVRGFMLKAFGPGKYLWTRISCKEHGQRLMLDR